MQDQVEEAIAEVTDGLERFPDEPLLLGLLGWAYYRAGNLEEAYRCSLEAVNREHEMWSERMAFAYYNLGLVALLLGKTEKSMEWYREAVKTGPGPLLDESIQDLEAVATAEIPETFGALAFLCEHRGEKERAIELYHEFLNLEPRTDEYIQLATRAIERLQREVAS
jgi:hypothetical protein